MSYYCLVMTKPATKTLPTLSFETQKHWEKWLAKNFATSDGIWLKIEKKDSSKSSVTYAEALDVAICFGWIDGQKNVGDQSSWLQKFTPRRAKSGWSKRNTEHVERLAKDGKMQPSGLAAVDAAKKDGRWHSAYESQKNSVIPEDFLKELSRDKKALAFFKSLNKANLYAIAYRLQTAVKPETRQKRMKAILEMMKKGQKFH